MCFKQFTGEVFVGLHSTFYFNRCIVIQALVGDKTLAFWLMDKEMYTRMSVMSEPSLIVDRGLALHKLIRMITFGLGGEGWLNFIGRCFFLSLGLSLY